MWPATAASHRALWPQLQHVKHRELDELGAQPQPDDEGLGETDDGVDQDETARGCLDTLDAPQGASVLRVTAAATAAVVVALVVKLVVIFVADALFYQPVEALRLVERVERIEHLWLGFGHKGSGKGSG